MKVRTAKTRHQAGLTLIESLMALAVVGVLLGSILPAFGTALERRHLEGAAAQLQTDIQYARSQAVAANAPLRMRFQQHATGSCYVVHDLSLIHI